MFIIWMYLSVSYRCLPPQLMLRQSSLPASPHLILFGMRLIDRHIIYQIGHCSLSLQMFTQGKIHFDVAIAWSFRWTGHYWTLDDRPWGLCHIWGHHTNLFDGTCCCFQSTIYSTFSIKKKSPVLWNSFIGKTFCFLVFIIVYKCNFWNLNNHKSLLCTLKTIVF